jgi:hypothetical protein
LIGFCISLGFDIIFLEFGFELFIAMFYSYRRSNQCSLYKFIN